MDLRIESTVGPDTGIPDLVRRLTDDSRRLVNDEVRLAKMEMRQGIREGTRGAMWLGAAFGAAVVALVAVTVLLCVAFGRLLDNWWAGALVTGAIELLAGFLFVKHGLSLYRAPDYSLPETRSSIADTARWARHPAAS